MGDTWPRFVLTYPDDSTPYLATAAEIGRAHDVLGRIGEEFPRVYYVDGHGVMQQATVKAEATPYDEQDWASVKVTILGVDGIELGSSSYGVDGRG
jgi:hypothetical protein